MQVRQYKLIRGKTSPYIWTNAVKKKSLNFYMKQCLTEVKNYFFV